jgi:hypothetical protein
MFTRATLLWAIAASLLLVSCSSSNVQDMNKGTDAAVGFVPPDAGPRADTALDSEGIDAEIIDMDAATDEASPDDGSVGVPVDEYD